MEDSVVRFVEDERVLCFHGPLLYDAKVIKTSKVETAVPSDQINRLVYYLIHYQGWKSKWDEWVPPERIRKYNDANLAEAAILKSMQKHNKKNNPQDQHKASSQSASKTGSNDMNNKPKGKKRGRKPMRESLGSMHQYNTSATSAPSSKRVSLIMPAVIPEDLPPINHSAEWLHVKPTATIELSEPLKQQLIDDWEFVTKQSRLVSLPRQPTVREIVSQLGPPAMALGLCEFFDRALGKLLLYRFERQQYLHAPTNPSDCYGAEHLLRLLVKLPYLVGPGIGNSHGNAEDILSFGRDIASYLNTNSLFMKEYDNAPSSYISLNKWL